MSFNVLKKVVDNKMSFSLLFYIAGKFWFVLWLDTLLYQIEDNILFFKFLLNGIYSLRIYCGKIPQNQRRQLV